MTAPSTPPPETKVHQIVHAVTDECSRKTAVVKAFLSVTGNEVVLMGTGNSPDFYKKMDNLVMGIRLRLPTSVGFGIDIVYIPAVFEILDWFKIIDNDPY